MPIPADIKKLPIAQVLGKLQGELSQSSNAVLQAEPGAGKTTGVPLALLDQAWLQNQRIIMLEPRRLAARAAAFRMAELLGEEVGQTVGYRMRLDNRTGPDTRLLVVTEGVLTRMLHEDPALENVGAIIFDEYHERSLNADLGLALTLDIQKMWRQELRILVMSATLEAERVADILDTAVIIKTLGRVFPVTVTHADVKSSKNGQVTAVARLIQRAVNEDSGSILAFLPGARAIHRVHRALKEMGLTTKPELHVAALYGSLPRHAQLEAIAAPPPGIRKIVLATDIAETSLTIEGVRVVVDSGLRKVPRFDPRTGMTRLETLPISRASSEQRRGRAGRIEPGVCYRAWSAAAHASRPEFDEPEILNADLASLALDLADWGVGEPTQLKWLDAPPASAYGQAGDLLITLNALDRDGRITAHGRAIQKLGVHPRLGHMLLKSKELDLGVTSCFLAALLSERDMLFSAASPADPDVALRLEALQFQKNAGPERKSIANHRIDRKAGRNICRIARRWQQQLKMKNGKIKPAEGGLALAFAYPDRIARQRQGRSGHFLLANGRGARLPDAVPLAKSKYLVVADLEDQGRDALIRMAAALDEEELATHFKESIESIETIQWDAQQERVTAHREWRLGKLTVRQAPVTNPDPQKVSNALLQGLRDNGINALPWSRETRNLQARMIFLRNTFGEDWPDVSEAQLVNNMEQWLLPFLQGITKLDDLKDLDLSACLLAMLTWEQRRQLDDLAPSRLQVPSGSEVRLDYRSKDLPVLAVRLQEMFGARQTPRVGGGRVPVLIQLLSPARQPVQTTQDLENFWKETYEQVRKDLRGRYPKHYWPENPLTAAPTKHAKPRN